MHAEARAFVGRWAEEVFAGADPEGLFVIELGSRNTSGERVRDLFGGARYLGVDAVAGAGVDVVANAAEWSPPDEADLVVCCEMFEHTPRWREVVRNAYAMLRPGGRAVFTCAGPGRRVHGVNHDDPDQPGYYGNVSASELRLAMAEAGFSEVGVQSVPHLSTNLGGSDTQATGIRPDPNGGVPRVNMVMTSLLTAAPDPQRGRRWDPDPSILDRWAGSILSAESVVVSDDAGFRHPGARVETVRPLPLSPYYARWFHCQGVLAEAANVDRVFITDGSDVRMLREPWGLMEHGLIYVGSEPMLLGCDWMRDSHQNPAMRRWMRRHTRLPLLNAGILGGYRREVLQFLGALCENLRQYPDVSDMAVFNFTARMAPWRDRVVTGPQVHTDFKSYSDNGVAWFSHK